MRNPLCLLRLGRVRADLGPGATTAQVRAAAVRDARRAAGEPPARMSIDLTPFRERLGLPDSATEEAVLAAVLDRLTVRRRPTSPVAPTELGPGVRRVPTAELEELQRQAADGRRAVQAARDWAILAAITEGRLTPFQARSVAEMWAFDPDGAREILTTRPPNTVPIAEIGHSHSVELSVPHAGDDELADQVINRQGNPS